MKIKKKRQIRTPLASLKFLNVLMNRKVVTETDFMKIMDLETLNVTYKNLVVAGFPIHRRELESVGSMKGTKACRRRMNHRVRIYYVE